MSNYQLNVVSHHKDFQGKSLKKYHVDGIDTVGAYGNEEFSVVFKNNTWQKVQVKLSIDGTDIFSGKPADTAVSDKMWVVNGYGELKISAWRENDFGGAAFIFTHAGNSVAIHTHGDMSSRGIIAAAVFVEGEKLEPLRVVEDHHHYHYGYNNYPYHLYNNQLTVPIWYSNVSGGIVGGGAVYTTWNTSSISNNTGYNAAIANMDMCFSADTAPAAEVDESFTKDLESVAACGAGQYVDQKISYVDGLAKPMFSETIRVRYLWWDRLKEKLQQANVAAPQPSGFPGDHHQGINLGNTPRLPRQGVVKRSDPISYQRV